MSSTEKRVFPRIHTPCPVLYRYGNSKPWKVGIMQNFSATGMLLTATEDPANEKSIHIHVKPGSQKIIPEIAASGEIMRVESSDNEFVVACKLTNISAT